MNSIEFRTVLYDALRRVTQEGLTASLRERSLVARVAIHLDRKIWPRSDNDPDQDAHKPMIDVDYRAAGADPKSGPWLSDNSRIREIEVDILLHDRVDPTADTAHHACNYVCMEFKLSSNEAKLDISDVGKIMYLIGRAERGGQPVFTLQGEPYRLGLCVRHRATTGSTDSVSVETVHSWTVDWFFPEAQVRTFKYPDHVLQKGARRDRILQALNEESASVFAATTESWMIDGHDCHELGEPPPGFVEKTLW